MLSTDQSPAADFTSLFNWNTKQLFVYVLATYPSLSPSSPPSQAIIWDTIIASPSQQHPLNPLELLGLSSAFTSKPPSGTKSKSKAKAAAAPKPKATAKPGVLSVKNVKPKYQITDVSGKLASRSNVTLEVGWNVQPWVGALTWTMRDENGWGMWKGMKGGRSEVFEMPGLKGKKAETTVGTGAVPKGGEASPVVSV